MSNIVEYLRLDIEIYEELFEMINALEVRDHPKPEGILNLFNKTISPKP